LQVPRLPGAHVPDLRLEEFPLAGRLFPPVHPPNLDTYLAARYWRLSRRISKRKAAVAVGHSILVICWHLLSSDSDYQDLGGDWFARRTDTDKRRDHLIRQLHDLGYGVTLTNLAA
jgi:hypothetical protein